MKDATGELSMTAIAVVAIGAIAVLFSTVVWPRIQATINRNTNCAQAYSCTPEGNGTKKCLYLDEDGNPQDVICTMDDGESGNSSSNSNE